MFDDLFKTDTKTDTKIPTTSSKTTGMFSDLFNEEQKQTTVNTQVTPTEPIAPTVTPVAPPKKNIFQKYADWTEKTGKAIGNWEKAKVLNFVESAKEKLATVGLYDYSKEYDATKDTVKPTIEELKYQNATIGYPKHNLIDPFMAGIGDVEQVTGSTMLWLNKKLEASDSKLKGLKQITSGVGTALQQEGEEMQGKYTDIKAQQQLGDFDWGDMLNPSWYHQNVLRAVPFSLALVPASLAAGSIGSVAGLGAFGTFVLSSILGGTTSRGLESATEAGTVYNDLRKQGFSHEDADKLANEVFKKNMSLTGLDIGEFALTFMPGGDKIKKYLPKGVMATGRVAFTGAMGGTEELLQKKFQDEAEGKTFSWEDPETKASAIIGTIMGGGLTTGALVVEGFKTKVLDNLPPDMKGNGKTDDDNLEVIAQQYPEETKEAIAEAVKETAKEEDEKIEAMTKIVEDVEEGLKTQSVAEVAQGLRDAGFNMKAINTIISTVTSEDPTATKDMDSATIIQQALQDNELDSTLADMKSKQVPESPKLALEETKTQEADNTTPGAVKPKGATETHIRVGTEGTTTIEGNEVTKDNAKVSYKVIDTLGGGQQPITTIKKTLIKNGVSEVDAESIISKTPVVEGMTYTDNVFDAITEHNNGVKSISEAQGEAKMKIKGGTKKVTDQIDDYIKDQLRDTSKGSILDNAYIYKDKKGKPDFIAIEIAEDLAKKVKKNSPLSDEDRYNFNELVKRIGQEDLLPGNALDTLQTKEDNKTYGTRKGYSEGVDGEIQHDKGGIKRGDTKSSVYSLETEGGRRVPISRRQTQGYTEPTNRQLPKKKESGEIKKIVSEFLYDAKPETINKIVEFYIKADAINMVLTIQRTNTLDGRSDFAAGMDSSSGTEFVLSLKESDMENIKPSDIQHEWGHSYWASLDNNSRKQLWSSIKEDYNNRKELYDTFEYKSLYWIDNIKFLKFRIYDTNLKAGKTAGSLEVNPILREVGLLDENNKVIIPEDVIEASFNFSETNKKINELLVNNGLETSEMTEEHNTLMADEINAFFHENVEEFKNSEIPEVKQYGESIDNNTIEFGNILEFGGQRFKLKDSTKLTSADIIKKHANIQLKRDIVITDVYGDKATLKAGEGITPYEVTGNKFILQDGEAYLVSKSQAQNVINNSKTGEAKPFAPELKQTEETIKGEPIRWIYDGEKGVALVDKNDKIIETGLSRDMAEQRVKNNTKYSQYTLPGGENYKEILIQAPVEGGFDVTKLTPKDLTVEETKYSQTQRGAMVYYKGKPILKEELWWRDNESEEDVKQQALDLASKYKNFAKPQEGFRSSHWSELNVIAHLRMNWRKFKGSSVAFMEELQSDWAREARKNGIINPLTESEKAEMKDYATRTQLHDRGQGIGLTQVEANRWAELTDRNQDLGKTPDNPLLKNWQELSIKRALQEAVNSNAKYFAWINGPQTAARYNLSKEVKEIRWKENLGDTEVAIRPATGGDFDFWVGGRDGKIFKSHENNWNGKKLDEVIGKGLAEKIMASPEGKLEGEGLNMGGEWATNLYDRQVRTIVENLTGQKVEMLDMGLSMDNNTQELEMYKRDLKLLEEPEGLAFVAIGDPKSKNNKWVVWQDEEPQSTFATEAEADAYVEELNKPILDGIVNREAKITELKKKIVSIPVKKSQQMGIELTPEVKQIINGEAPQVKVSGKLPFEQITAPVMFKIKLPDVNTGNKAEDAKQILAHVEKKLGVTSIVNSIKDKELAIEIAKEALEMSPMQPFEEYMANGGTYKGQLPEVGASMNDFRRNTNKKAIEFAKEGDSLATELTGNPNLTSEDVRDGFEDYINQKERIVKQEKEVKQQKDLFKTTDTFKLAGQDKTLIGEITQTREMPQAIMEIMDQVKTEKKARREEVLNHKARPLMKYVDKKTQKLPKIGSKTAFGKEGEQILKDLKFDDVNEANKALSDYISKRNEFVNPVSRLALQERAAKFLRDKQKILEEVEKQIRAEARDRKQKLESIRDFFYMTEGEMKDAIGDKDYRLLSDSEFEVLLKEVEEKSIEIAQHTMAVAEVEWTIAEKELHRVENMQEVLGYNKDLNKLTTEELDNLNAVLGKYEKGDVFLGVREMETLAKNANLPDVKTQRQILEEVLGKRTGLPIETLREIVVGSFDTLRSAVSLARQNAFYEVLVSDFYQLKIEAGLRYREIEQKTNELVRLARKSRPQSWKQKLAPTDDMVIAYLEEGDLPTKALIAKDMTPQELELAHYVRNQYAEMRDFLISRQQLDKERQNYYTHRPRGFFEAWLRDGQTKTPTQFITAFGRAFKETFIDVNKMDEATFKILNEQTEEILPLEKFFKYSMRRSGQLIPTKNLANAFLGYTKTFELKKGLDQYMPRMEAVARALTPTETTEGGVVKDTSLEKFVKKWINTQKGRPVTVGPIEPGGVLDGLLRSGIAFTRFLDLAYRLPAQIMSLVGEETSTWINIGTKKYILGEYRAKTAQGNKIAKKYESFVGTKFWDKMREESAGIGSKLGETMFAFYGIAARNANIHHLLGVLTAEEFRAGEVSPERLVEIKMEMNRWRADDLLHSVMGKTSVGAMFREHKSWAIPIVNQTLSNLKKLSGMVSSGEYLKASKSKEFGELFRGTMLTLILVLTISRIYKDLKEKKDRTFVEELEYRAMNDAQSFLAALSPTTLGSVPRLAGWFTDLIKAVTSFAGALATGERTATGDIPGATGLGAAITPKLIKPLFKEDEEDKIQTSIDTSTIKAQKELDEINKEIVEPAQTAWEEVKKLGVGTEEADAVVSELADDEYEAYKLVKKADNDYWTSMAEKVTPIVNQAFKLEFGTEEADKLVEPLSDDEYAMYKTVKNNLYGKGDATAQPTDWDKQSFITHVKNIAKGWSTDPVDAFDKLIHGDWKITKVKGGAIIVNRMPVDASQKIREEAAKNNENYRLDHVIPLTASGDNRKSNLNIISTDEWEENTPVEVYLGKQLDEGNISAKQAEEYIVRFKIGRGQVTSGPLFEKYKTPITFEEIKQEIAK